MAWKPLTVTYRGQTKGANGACREKVDNLRMEPGQDPDDFAFVLNQCRYVPEEMTHTVHDERYEDLILQAFPPKFERVPTASFERKDFGQDVIWHMVHTMYFDNVGALSTPSQSQAVEIPCRWWGTTSLTLRATTAKEPDTSHKEGAV